MERVELRHACQGCGGSCRGVNVRPVGADEAARIEQMGAALGVASPLVDGRLRRVDGGCVFLDGDRCRIHAEVGPDAKPLVCSQYPLVAVQTEAGLRVGIDPGCYRHAAMWRDGPALTPSSVRAGRLSWPPAAAAMEAAALAAASAPTLAAALAGVVGGASTEAVPSAFVVEGGRRLLGLGAVLDDEDCGAALRAALRPLADAAPAMAEGMAGPWRLDAAAEAYALDAVQRVVRLRLLHHLGSPYNAAFLALAGAVLTGLAAPDRHGEALAGWLRGLRAGPFVRLVVGDGLPPWVAAAQG